MLHNGLRSILVDKTLKSTKFTAEIVSFILFIPVAMLIIIIMQIHIVPITHQAWNSLIW